MIPLMAGLGLIALIWGIAAYTRYRHSDWVVVAGAGAMAVVIGVMA